MGTVEFMSRLELPDPALFAGRSEREIRAWCRYFYTTPAIPGKPPSLRAHALALYDPFAKRSDFPAGIRLCANVYVGCENGCYYCYVRNYIPAPDQPRRKKDFIRRAMRDLRELDALQVPPVPLHISNSTDPFQAVLECKYQDTLRLLELIVPYRHRFTTITFLTKNALLTAQPAYINWLHALRPCQVEVSVSFADETSRQMFEPFAPPIPSRLEGIRRLRAAGIPVSLRIDPLFPREPLSPDFWPKPRLTDYGLDRTHTLEEIESLVRFAAETACQKIVVSPLKVPVGRWASLEFKERFRELYGAPFGGKPRTRSFAWRLPEDYVDRFLIGPVKEMAATYGVAISTCAANLLNTR